MGLLILLIVLFALRRRYYCGPYYGTYSGGNYYGPSWYRGYGPYYGSNYYGQNYYGQGWPPYYGYGRCYGYRPYWW